MADTKLFDEKTRRKLEQVMLWSQRARAGATKGERRSTKRGTSIEFADYRNYTRGDDLRRLDWNIYARLERPYIKLLEDEEDLAVHVLVDTSASMDWPKEREDFDRNKFVFARRLAAGLAYTSMTSNDRLRFTAVSDRGSQSFGPSRGRARALAMLKFADELKSGGVTDLNYALEDYGLRESRPGLVFVISDMFSPTGHMDGVSSLMSKGYEVVILHLLSPEEVNPPLVGDLRLIDVETGSAQEVTVDANMREIYIRRLDAWRDSIRSEILRRGGHYLFIETSIPWERVILQDLRRSGLLK